MSEAAGPPPAARPRTRRMGAGPLGALPALSPSTRRALVWCGSLALANAVALVLSGWSLATVLAAIVAGHPGDIGHPLAGFGLAVTCRAMLAAAMRTAAARAAADAERELRGVLLDAATRRGPEWIAAQGPGELTSLATTGVDALNAYFTRFLPALVSAAVVPLVVGAAIVIADWRSAVLIALTLPLIPLFAVLIGRYTAAKVADAVESNARLSGFLLELVRALPVLTAFRRAATQERAVREVSERHRRATMSTLRIAFLSALVLELISTLSVALVAVDIGLRLLGGSLGLATGLLVLILTPECYLPLRAVGAAHHASEDGLEVVRRVQAIADPGDDSRPSGGVLVPDARGHLLQVSHLRVRRRDRYAPDDVSFVARTGEITRLDSPSGAGKSSTLAVLLGFVTADEGTVTVDGTDLASVDLVHWRKRVAWVPQRPTFSAETVADELRLAVESLADGDEIEPPTEDELREVAARAAADHLLDRTVEELSTGEKQRVAVARALLRLRRGAWLLLADEPTAHLDQATAATVAAALREAADQGAAVVVAAHHATAADTPVPARPTAGTARPPECPSTVRGRLRELVDARMLAGVGLGAAALASGVALTGTAAWLIARASEQPPIFMLTVAIVAVRAFGLGKGALRYAERLVSHDAAFRISGRLRVRLWQALVALGPARSAALRRTDGLRRLVDDTDRVRDLVPRVSQPPLVAALLGMGAVAVQAALLPAAGVVLAVAFVIAGIAGPAAALVSERRASRALALGRRRLAGAVLSLLDAAADLIACGADLKRRAAVARLDTELAARARRQAWGSGIASGLATGALGFASLGSAWLAASSVAAGTLNPLLAPVLALVPLALAEVVDGLAPAAQELAPLRMAYGRVVEVPHVPDQPAVRGLTRGPTGDIELIDVDVRWPGADDLALRGVNVRVPAGTWVTVLGPSGAGKSTLIALLLGFLTPARGRAVICENVAWCPQEAQLVSTTVRENLRVGEPDADDTTLREVLRAVALDDWVDRLDIPLGSRGAMASGGEAARLALARALLRAPKAQLVLLDEPTAQLDEPTARRIRERLAQRLAGRTVLHVTHQPAEASHADLVIEVVDGRVRLVGGEPPSVISAAASGS